MRCGNSLLFSLLIYVSSQCRSTADNAIGSVQRNFTLGTVGGGFGNRLNAFASFIFISRDYYKQAIGLCIWETELEHAPGHYLEVLKPLDDIVFSSNMKIIEEFRLERIQLHWNFNVAVRLFYSRHHRPMTETDINAAKIETFARLHPTDEVRDFSAVFIRENRICDILALHIRRTDRSTMKQPVKKDEYYFNLIDTYYGNTSKDITPFFLLTDNFLTQQTFINRYGFHNVKVVRLFNDSISMARAELKRISHIRDTMNDIYIASHAHTFYGEPLSSLSDVVKYFREAHHRPLCSQKQLEEK